MPSGGVARSTPEVSWARPPRLERTSARSGLVFVLAVLVLTSCAAPAPVRPAAAAASAPSAFVSAPSPSGQWSVAPSPGAPGTALTPAGVGRTAPSQRLTFAPQRVRLVSHGGVRAVVRPVDTGPQGDLELPDDPAVTGWWVSGALAGELYGSVVLAGHIDSRESGLGYFASLLDARPGDRIELSGGGLALTYVVRSNREVDKDVLSRQTDLADRGASGRLVLLTCTGTFDRRTRHYDRNLMVTALPVGVPHRP